MSILFLLLPVALLLGFGFLFAFIWGASGGQFDDLETPAHRVLLPDSTEEFKTGEKRHV
ncbi:MAG: cbb3-type cytochrome oxidase assembly protein CcoS [Bdellovibrionales bacterium]|nr:cbb3-type cytochrome oxidase assembly protein CcoS [Bdellovibrionales bacterium]